MRFPAPTRSRLRAWDGSADGLVRAAADWRTAADQWERSADVYAGQVVAPDGTEWLGLAAEATEVDANAVRGAVYRGAERVRGLAQAAAHGAEGLRWGRDLALAAIADAERDGFQVCEDLSVTEPPANAPGMRSGQLRAHREHIVHWAMRLQTEDERIATHLRAGAAGLVRMADALWGSPEPAGHAADTAALPPPETAAAQCYRWWQQLTPEQQARLVAAHPPRLGNLNGIPAAVRGEINLAVMNDDIGRVVNGVRSLGISPADLINPDNEVFAHPDRYGLGSVDIIRYRNAKNTSDGLRYHAGGDAARPVMLWAYDPLAWGGQGKAVIAIGDPDTARHTAVIVPGTGSSVAQGWLTGHVDAVNVYDQSAIADPGSHTAVLAWMGYDAPDGFVDTRISQPGPARQGGDLLARDINGLRVTHGATPQHVTVIGHSYGATTVADACSRGQLHATDAILLGCPGTDLARTAADFHLDGGRVYVGAASTDPVSWIGQSDGVPREILKNQLRALGFAVPFDAGLGRDPAGEGFGAIRFHAEVPGSEHLNRHDHSHYYLLGSEALRAMTEIVTGHPERLATDGLLADGRRQPHIGIPPWHLPGLPGFDMRIPGLPGYIDPEGARGAVRDNHAYR